MTTKRTSTSREYSPNSLKTASALDTQVATLTAEETMDADQVDESDGISVNTDGPLNSTDETREICRMAASYHHHYKRST
jgi:hypothetical protein